MRTLCLRCFKATSACYCAVIRPFDAAIRIVILIHPKERRKSIGTGRMTHLSIRGSLLLEGVSFEQDTRVNALIADPANFCAVVYPGKAALDITRGAVAQMEALVPRTRQLTLFILDSNWDGAQKMLFRSPNLKGLPQIRFTPPHPSLYAIRRQPQAHCFSTIETVHFLLGELSLSPRWPAPGRDSLIEVFQFMVRNQLCHAAGGRKRAERGERHAMTATTEIPPCTPSPLPSTAT